MDTKRIRGAEEIQYSAYSDQLQLCSINSALAYCLLYT